MKSRTVSSGISLLNFDDTLPKQALFRGYPAEWIDCTDLSGCHGYCSFDTLVDIQNRLKVRKYKNITLIGNGNYHYVTYVLLSEIKQPFSLVLFDHHTDLAWSGDTLIISCGSWVGFALKTLPQLQQVVIIGAHSSNEQQEDGISEKITIISEQEVTRSSTREVVQLIRSILPDHPIYISVDKDVLNRDHAVTNWDQGSMTLGQLLQVIRELKRLYPLAGVDVCGELPLSPVEVLFDQRVRYIRKNEIANKAIVDELLAG